MEKEQPKPDGLLFGAGASYELGMPLVSEFTNEIRSRINKMDIRSVNDSWKEQGGGYPDDMIDELLDQLSHAELNYENILGFFQIMYNRHGGHGVGQKYAGLFSWLSELIYFTLYGRHINNVDYIKAGVSMFDG
ncbi:hypothetical protein ACFL4G_13240, partial [Thermodesulfobacteriota bacterium]